MPPRERKKPRGYRLGPLRGGESELPVVPLRDLVVFPNIVVPLFVGRERSIAAVQQATQFGTDVVVIAQRSPAVDYPQHNDLYDVGAVARIIQSLRAPDGTLKIFVQAANRGRVVRFIDRHNYLAAVVRRVLESEKHTTESLALERLLSERFNTYLELNPLVPEKVSAMLSDAASLAQTTDIVAAHLTVKNIQRQVILEMFDPVERAKSLLKMLDAELEILTLQKNIDSQIRSKIHKTQKDFYLKEQLRVIEEELGETDPEHAELADLRRKILDAKMPPDAEKEALQEHSRLARTPPFSPQHTVHRNYIDWLISLPWQKKTEDSLNLQRAGKILDEDHYGLDKPKQRILEYLAVRRLSDKMKGPILCFVGPPGVGKTSLARSIARSMGRVFVRKSLGGVRDEAEIRGHRRTYIGALPGRIIQTLKKGGTKNPLFLLDEIDKLSKDYHGDPASALLEVLDPEENHSFSDHYLEVEFDLSDVFFICTANFEDAIPHVLRDRMEVIRLSGYTALEKNQIARRHLIPKQLERHGLGGANINIDEDAMDLLIHRYTNEAGVRDLEKHIASLFRKIAKEIVSEQDRKSRARKTMARKKFRVPRRKFNVTGANIEKGLGVPRFRETGIEADQGVGIATALAWTEAGGTILAVEATKMKGKGQLTLTGKLGDVMQESARAALSYIRANAARFGIDPDFYKATDLHVHVPEGAIPKDGPSAGLAIAGALVSMIAEEPMRRDVALTGEITLRGRVLPVGGVKEKVLAAHREGLKMVIMPAENKKDLRDVPKEVTDSLRFVFVEEIDQIFPRLFLRRRRIARPSSGITPPAAH